MFSFYIAKRYLLTKRSHHAINIISGIAVTGVAVATAALVCIMSVFNGFQDMIADLFTAFDPQLKVVPAEGKFMDASAQELKVLKDKECIAIFSEVLEDNALLSANNHQVMATLKGVDDNFEDLIDFERIKFGNGVYELHADVLDYGILGINLLGSLGLGTDFSEPIQVYAPRGEAQIDLNDPSESFNQEELYSPHIGFNMKQQKYDSHYALTSLRLTQRLFEREGQLSSVELQLTDGTDTDRAKKEIQRLLGDKYKVLDRYEQQEDTFKIMQIEKLMSYVFLVLILVIACFNIIGSLSMLIIDKKDDAITLRNLGASDRQIADIFMLEGRLIALAGAVIGIIVGLILCYIQQTYGIIRFGQSAGSYIIDAYPVNIHAMDIIIIFVTVVIVGFLSVWYPVRQLSKKFTSSATVLALLFVTAGITSCGPSGNNFELEGTFEDMPVGVLYVYNTAEDMPKLDTLQITDGKFRYKGAVSEVTPFYLVFPNALEQVVFAGPGDALTYKASANDLKNYTVGGNDENQLMNQFRRETDKLSGIQLREKASQYIMQHAESPVALYLFERYFLQESNVSTSDIKAELKVLQDHWKDNPLILSTKQRIKGTEQGHVGKKLPSIKLKTKRDKEIDIANQKSDLTLLVFWASWMPREYEYQEQFRTFVNEYATNTERLSIITISLDNQQYRWEELARTDTTYCHHTHDGLAWETPAAKKLGIQSVPAYILADKNHKIIATGHSIDEMKKDVKKAME